MIVVTLRYMGIEYLLEDNDLDLDTANFMYSEGNYSCDCNRSLFISEQCDSNFPEMDCGDTIELVGIALLIPLV